MNSRVLLIASSFFLGAVGIAASFAPHELLAAMGVSAEGPLPVVVQLAGALYLGFALTNWTAKGSLVGGVYARPISLGNFFHFVVGALALTKYESASGFAGPLLVVWAAYVAFAVGFGLLVFRPAKASGSTNSR
mgnify:FL=1